MPVFTSCPICGSSYIAIDCVGAVPYLSGLRTLDRVGLTDAHVAHSPFVRDVMAHGKQATESYARERGVDFWAIDYVFLLWDLANPNFPQAVLDCCLNRREAYFAALGEGRYLLASLPSGIERTRRRFPALRFESTLDQEAVNKVLDAAAEVQVGGGSGGGR